MTRSRKTTEPAVEASEANSRSRSQSLVARLSGDLLRRIQDGSLAVGVRLPSVRKYAQECAVSNETVLRVYDKLVALGYLEARRGAGFFVKPKPQPTAQERRPSWAGAREQGWSWLRVLTPTAGAEPPAMGSGALPASWMNQEAMSHALRGLQQTLPEVLAGYADPRGYRPLRELLQSKLLAQGIQAPLEQIITTSGASDALNLVIWSHFYPRDYVLVEEPASLLHIQRLLASGLEIVCVPRRDDGPDLEALEAACLKYKPRAFFTSSVLQSPCSTTMSPYKAYQVLRIAEAHDLLVIDDDSYGDLLPSGLGGHVARLAALDLLQRVIHIGSFSKTLAPGVRAGYLAASTSCIERICLYRTVGAIHGPLLTDLFMHHVLAQDGYRQHCESLHARLDDARVAAQTALDALGCKAALPAAGMYVWADLGVDADAVAQQCDGHGLATAPGSAFLTRGACSTYMRFNVCALAQPGPSLQLLADVLQQLRA